MAEELGQRNLPLGVHSFALIPLPNLPRHPWRNGPEVGRFGAVARAAWPLFLAGKCRIVVHLRLAGDESFARHQHSPVKTGLKLGRRFLAGE